MKVLESNIDQIFLKKIKSEFSRKQIKCSDDAQKFARQFYDDDIEIYESVFIILLNRSNTTIGYTKLSQGGISSTVIDIRLLTKYAIDTLASSVILVHNHPSGNTSPSNADLQITENSKKALQIFDINVLDHIILTKDNYLSFGDENLL